MLSQIAIQILCRISSVIWLQQFNCNGIWSRCSAIGNLKNISFFFLLHLWWFPFDYVKLFYDFIFFIKELFTVLFPSLTHWLWVCEFLTLLSLMAIIIGWNELPGFPLFEKKANCLSHHKFSSCSSQKVSNPTSLSFCKPFSTCLLSCLYLSIDSILAVLF